MKLCVCLHYFNCLFRERIRMETTFRITIIFLGSFCRKFKHISFSWSINKNKLSTSQYSVLNWIRYELHDFLLEKYITLSFPLNLIHIFFLTLFVSRFIKWYNNISLFFCLGRKKKDEDDSEQAMDKEG